MCSNTSGAVKAKRVMKVSAWNIIKPYWFSEDRWKAWLLLGVVVGFSFLSVQVSVYIGIWTEKFFNALFGVNLKKALHLLPLYAVLIR